MVIFRKFFIAYAYLCNYCYSDTRHPTCNTLPTVLCSQSNDQLCVLLCTAERERPTHTYTHTHAHTHTHTHAHTHTHTHARAHTHTHETTTVTLAAHVRRDLLNYPTLEWCRSPLSLGPLQLLLFTDCFPSGMCGLSFSQSLECYLQTTMNISFTLGMSN